jgi:hypothetical protein
MDTQALIDATTQLQTNLDIVWTCVAAFLVFFMQAGFAMVETGFTRAKNVVNIMMKNLMDFSIGSLAFFFLGFGLMFGVTNACSAPQASVSPAPTGRGGLGLHLSYIPDRVRRHSRHHRVGRHG